MKSAILVCISHGWMDGAARDPAAQVHAFISLASLLCFVALFTDFTKQIGVTLYSEVWKPSLVLCGKIHNCKYGPKLFTRMLPFLCCLRPYSMTSFLGCSHNITHDPQGSNDNFSFQTSSFVIISWKLTPFLLSLIRKLLWTC